MTMTAMNRLVFLLLTALFLGANGMAAEESSRPAAQTIQDQNVPLDILKLEIRHMPSEQLFVEADAWKEALSGVARKVYESKIGIEKINSRIKTIGSKEGNATDAEDAQEIETLNKEKDALLKALDAQRAERKDVTLKLEAILDNIDEKIGYDEKGKEKKEVQAYRRYIDAVNGITVDISDTKSTIEGMKEWFLSPDGGVFWLISIGQFFAIMFLTWFLSILTSNAVKKAVSYSQKSSELLNTFLVGFVKKSVLFLGLLFALSFIGINVTPILAAIGAAGFVVAFALQGTLSNFASGIMIMFYKPFDVGDVVDVAGIVGTVESMTMVSTNIVTADNRLMIVPNNTIWGNIITNVTHSDKRRVDLTFGIGYDDDIDKAQLVLLDVLEKHPLILKDPKPTVQVHELADSSVNFICRPWTLTPDYWTVYWEITRRVKIRFDEEGISIPYPQQDIHIISSVEEKTKQTKKAFTHKGDKEIDSSKMDSEEDQ